MHRFGKGKNLASVLKYHGKMWCNFACATFGRSEFRTVQKSLAPRWYQAPQPRLCIAAPVVAKNKKVLNLAGPLLGRAEHKISRNETLLVQPTDCLVKRPQFDTPSNKEAPTPGTGPDQSVGTASFHFTCPSPSMSWRPAPAPSEHRGFTHNGGRPRFPASRLAPLPLLHVGVAFVEATRLSYFLVPHETALGGGGHRLWATGRRGGPAHERTVSLPRSSDKISKDCKIMLSTSLTLVALSSRPFSNTCTHPLSMSRTTPNCTISRIRVGGSGTHGN